MLVYPQLSTGAISQYPVRKRHRLRTVVNRSADGSAIKLADAAGEASEWSLTYVQLSDDEAGALEGFFEATEGSLNSFTFLDPVSNLLSWSDDLNQAAWVRDPVLTLTAGVSDAAGGTAAWHLSNSGHGPQSITQTLSAPSEYLYCFSAYLRSASAEQVTMLVGGQRAERAIGPDWTRAVLTVQGAPGGESISFGLEVAGGGEVDVYGMQAEPQAGASTYQSSTRGGVYENARLRDDVLTITTTGVNQHSCTVNIYYAKHL